VTNSSSLTDGTSEQEMHEVLYTATTASNKQ